MICVPGGPAILGADDGRPEEKPRQEVEVSTFYMDRYEVTNRQYDECVAAEACPRRPPLPAAWKPFLAAEAPATPMSWEMAHDYCVWAGKRLPTEAEWEKAARAGAEGRVYPWGDAPATCERAVFGGCDKDSTEPVGSRPPGPLGFYDLAGNGFEWVADWWSPCRDGCRGACGPSCRGRDPLGPCEGGPKCPGRSERVLKGGSWAGPAAQLRGAARRAGKPFARKSRLSFRCASSDAVLTSWPPLALSDPLPALAEPSPPTAEELAMFRDVVQDDDILKIEPCVRRGMARLDCRDPMTYIKSNETMQRVWLPYIQNLGGGYVGLGADQSYSFIAAARSRWAWIFDYDPAVVRLHTIIRVLVSTFPARREFAEAFAPRQLPQTRKLLREALAEDPNEQRAVDEVLRNVRHRVYWYYVNESKPRANGSTFGWLRSDESYAYIRTLLAQGRIIAIKGNMLTDKALPSVARSARALGVPVRIYYPSNAEEQWRLTPQYRANVAGFPFDERSVILRTQIGRRFRDDESDSYWHYIVHAGLDAQRRIVLPGYTSVTHFMADHLNTEEELLSVIRLPARTVTEPLQVGARAGP
jgi:formylglycine-generating enzyme required for sulfatase activity